MNLTYQFHSWKLVWFIIFYSLVGIYKLFCFWNLFNQLWWRYLYTSHRKFLRGPKVFDFNSDATDANVYQKFLIVQSYLHHGVLTLVRRSLSLSYFISQKGCASSWKVLDLWVALAGFVHIVTGKGGNGQSSRTGKFWQFLIAFDHDCWSVLMRC